MSIVKMFLVAASLAVAASSAYASSRADLESGYHGNTPVYKRSAR